MYDYNSQTNTWIQLGNTINGIDIREIDTIKSIEEFLSELFGDSINSAEPIRWSFISKFIT